MLQHRFPALSEPARDAIVRLTESLNAVASSSFRDDPPTATALRLSLRQILRLTRHVNTSAGVPLSVAIGESVKELLMLQFMPEPARIAVNAVLQALFPISSAVSASAEGPSFKPVVTDGVLYFGDVSHPQHKPEFPELVPSPLFYDIPR